MDTFSSLEDYYGFKGVFHSMIHRFLTDQPLTLGMEVMGHNLALIEMYLFMRLAFMIYDANNNKISHALFNMSALRLFEATIDGDSIELRIEDYFGSRNSLSDEDRSFMKQEMYRVVMDENGHPRCAVTISPKAANPNLASKVLISFMGTNFGSADWPINLNGIRTAKYVAKGDDSNLHDLQVHRGYKVMFDYLWTNINGIRSLLYIHFGERWNNVEVYITGHSMGGAH